MLIALGMALLAPIAQAANIYGYVDEKGVAHFASEPLDARYQLFFKAGQSFDTSAGLPSYPPPLAPPSTAGVSFASVPKILLGLGAFCLLVAAVIFLAVSWSTLGVGGRTAVLAGATLTAGAAALLLHRIGLRIAGESLVVVALVSMACMAGIRFEPLAQAQGPAQPQGRPVAALMREPAFLVAALGAALGYGVMNLLMAATPLAMQVCGYAFGDAALVLEWHVIGMFAPGFFTGHLIKRFGVPRVMGAGVLLNAICVAVALSGVELERFVAALFLLGVGWNFLFTGSTALALQAYRPEEKDRAQAAINFCVFATMALTSFASGALVTTQGWTLLNWGSLLPIGATGLALLWLAGKRRAVASY